MLKKSWVNSGLHIKKKRPVNKTGTLQKYM